MLKNKLSVRQICIIMCVYGAASKLMLYPTTMAAACGNLLWASILLNTALQSAIVWGVCFLSERTGVTFFELVQRGLGKTVARIIYAVYAVYFLFSAFAPMVEQQLMVHEAFYDTIPSILVFLPFFIFAVYAGSKGLTNAGRTAEICLPVFAVTVFLLLVMSAMECDFSALLPFGARKFSEVLSGCGQGFFRFDGGAVMLMFMGNYEKTKRSSLKIALSSAIGGITVAVVAAVFWAVYSDLAVVQYFAITKISIFFSAISLIGRTDLLAVYALDIAMLFSIVLNIQLASYALTMVFARPLTSIYSLALNAVLLALAFALNNKFALVQSLASSVLGWATLACAYVLPLAAWGLKFMGGRREKA